MFRCVAVVCLCCCGVATADSASPLTDYLSHDVALYAEISDLDAHWTRVEASGFGQQWQQSPFYQAATQGPILRRWRGLDAIVAAKTQTTFTGHLRKLFGRQVGVALWLPAGAGPQGLLLARGLSAADVEQVVATWNRLDAQVTVTTRGSAPAQYVARAVGAAEPNLFYAVRDDLFILSDHETLVRNTVEKMAGSTAGGGESLTQSVEFQRCWPQERMAGELSAYFAARRWDQSLAQINDKTPAVETFLKNWQGVSSVGLQGRWSPEGVNLRLTTNFDPASLSDSWRQFAASRETAPSILTQAPAEALVVIGGGLPRQLPVVNSQSWIPEHERREWDLAWRLAEGLLLGQAPWQQGAGALLHDFGAYVLERPAGTQKPQQSHPFIGVWVSEDITSSPSERTLLAGLENGISFAVNGIYVAAASEASSATVTLERTGQHEKTQQWFIAGHPQGELALELSPHRLAISTSIDQLKSLASRGSSEPVSRLNTTATERFPGAQLFVWAPLSAWRDRPWSRWVQQKLPETDLPRPVQELLVTTVLSFDEAYFSVQARETQLQIQLGAIPRDSAYPPLR